MALIKSLLTLDLFGTPLSLFFNKSKKRSSKIGLFFTFCIIGFLTYEFLQSDFIKKERPIVVSQTIDTSHAAPLLFDKNHLLIFTIGNSYNQRFSDSSIFSIVQ